MNHPQQRGTPTINTSVPLCNEKHKIVLHYTSFNFPSLSVCLSLSLSTAMGGNNRQQKKSSSPFSFFNMFKAKRYSSKVVEDNSWDDSVKYYKVWPSDEDRGRYVAEPGIDRKASAYIAKIRTQCVADHDLLASN